MNLRQVSEFKSDTIQTTSENCAFPTKRHCLNSFFKSSKRTSAPSAPPLTLAIFESESRRITEKDSCVFLAFGSPRRALSQRRKIEKKCAGKLHSRIHVLVEYQSRGEERPHGASSVKPSCQLHVCVILSFSYLILRLLVSPRSQQQLHSCGVTFARGRNESSVAITLYIEGEGGTHHSSKKREKEENMREVRSGREVE